MHELAKCRDLLGGDAPLANSLQRVNDEFRGIRIARERTRCRGSKPNALTSDVQFAWKKIRSVIGPRSDLRRQAQFVSGVDFGSFDDGAGFTRMSRDDCFWSWTERSDPRVGAGNVIVALCKAADCAVVGKSPQRLTDSSLRAEPRPRWPLETLTSWCDATLES